MIEAAKIPVKYIVGKGIQHVAITPGMEYVVNALREITIKSEWGDYSHHTCPTYIESEIHNTRSGRPFAILKVNDEGTKLLLDLGLTQTLNPMSREVPFEDNANATDIQGNPIHTSLPRTDLQPSILEQNSSLACPKRYCSIDEKAEDKWYVPRGIEDTYSFTMHSTMRKEKKGKSEP